MRTLLVIVMSFAATVAWAQNPGQVASKRSGPYLGVQPGMKDLAPGKDKVKSRGAIRFVTWVGFQMAGQGGRVFIQSTEPPAYTIVPGAPDEVIIEMTNSKLHRTNDGRPLDTAWFPTAVREVDAKQLKGNRVQVKVSLREVVGYDLRQEGNYLFLDFRPPTKPITPPAVPNPGAAATN